MNIRHARKIVVLGMLTRMPVAGVIWQNWHYLIGLRRLGYDPYYVEAHGMMPTAFMETEHQDPSPKAAAYIDRMMRRIDMGDRWCFQSLHDQSGSAPRCFGLSQQQLMALYQSAELIINLHGGTLPRPEHYKTGRLVFLETDPVQVQIELHDNCPETIDYLSRHCAFFTFGENYGAGDCGLPVDRRFHFHHTRQPVVMDWWQSAGGPDLDCFTTVGNWQQPVRQVSFRGKVYHWSKHYEFMKIIDLPRMTLQPLELALSSYSDQDKSMLLDKGWRIRHALDLSTEPDPYRDYISRSRGEFTVAKDQNVRLRSGWFSDRSATYLAAGRPVVTQDTGFGAALPTGRGLFAFSDRRSALHAIEQINADYAGHRAAARQIAQEYFSHDRVLQPLLREVGA